MTEYEKLQEEITIDGYNLVEIDFTADDLHGLYCDGWIGINKNLTTAEKIQTAYEEWGHAKTNTGNILDQHSLANRKQEQRARRWAYDKHIPVDKFVQTLLDNRPTDTWELLDILNITHPYLIDLLNHYQQRYGPYYEFQGGCLWFNPIDIALFE